MDTFKSNYICFVAYIVSNLINKMSLYPSLEDMKVDTMVRAQMAQHQAPPSYSLPPAAPMPSHMPSHPSAPSGHVYPALGEYMGLELSSDIIALNMPEYQLQPVSLSLKTKIIE